MDKENGRVIVEKIIAYSLTMLFAYLIGYCLYHLMLFHFCNQPICGI